MENWLNWGKAEWIYRNIYVFNYKPTLNEKMAALLTQRHKIGENCQLS